MRAEFTYDSYARVAQTRRVTAANSVEDRCQRVDYTYDEGGGYNTGRLTRVRWNWTVNNYNQEVACAAPGRGVVIGFEERYAYTAAGRVSNKTLAYSRMTYNGQVQTATLAGDWSYNNEGQVSSVLYPQHQEMSLWGRRRQVTYGYDGMARINSVQTKLETENDPSPSYQSVISNVSFNAFGSISGLTHLGVSESRSYNALGQMTRMTKGSLIDVEYRFSATANDGKIVSQKNWLTGEDVVYAYDELERLIRASTTNNASWGLSFSYDGFGNRLAQSVTQGSGPVSSLLVDALTNRISSSGYSYDANGNMTAMPKGGGTMSLSYDSSNRMTNASHPAGSEDYLYAPDNRRVWRNAGTRSCQSVDNNGTVGASQFEMAGEQVIFYSPGGQKMGVYCVDWSASGVYGLITASEEHVYMGARLVGKRIYAQNSWTGQVSDFTADRLQSKGNGSNYYPYGESKSAAAGDDREGFATYTRDGGTGLDYADQRYYASGLGRFGSVDPGVGEGQFGLL